MTKRLLPDQEAAISYAYERDYSLLRLPTGFGKTVVAMTAAQELIRDGVLTRVLVLAPLRVIEGTWSSEPNEWDHITVKVALAVGSEKARLNAFASDAEVVVMNYENVAWWKGVFGKEHGFDGIIYDEITRLKSVSGTQFKALRSLYDTFKWRCGMGARSDNDGLIDMYGQAMMIDGGKALGRRKETFLLRWFTPLDYQQYNWEPKPGAAQEIARLTGAFTYAPDPAGYEDTLPRLWREYHVVELPAKAEAAYRELAKHSVLSSQGIAATNAAIVSGKLQQVCAGFIYDDDDVVRLHEEKKNMVWALYESHKDRPVLISYWFDEELAMLQELFPNAPVVGQECTAGLVERWNRGDVPVMLIHPRSGGHGLNIQYGGFQLIMFGPVWSNDLTHQLISRLRRRGQPSDVVKVMVVVAGDTLETEVMIPRVEHKQESSEKFGQHLLSLAG